MNEHTTFRLISVLVLLLTLGMHVLAWRMLREVPGPDATRRRSALLGVFVLMSAVAAYIALFSGHPLPPGVAKTAIWVFMLWSVLLALGMGMLWLHRRRLRGYELPTVDEKRRELLLTGASGLSILTFGGAVFDVSSDEDVEVVYKSIAIRRLPAKLHGLRIGMISDIHSGPFMEKKDIDRYVTRLNALNTDVILLPGDFIQNRNEEADPLCESLKVLRAPYGVYGSTGNHEFFADADQVSRELGNAGIIMLRNEHRIIDPHGEKLALIGLDDVRSGHPFPALFRKAARGLDPAIPNITLCHKPYYIEEAAEYGLDLMVSGHTHGGQIVLARLFGAVLTPASIISGYIEGLYSLDATQMYITRGVGMTGLPIRVNCPPEITVITLVKAGAD